MIRVLAVAVVAALPLLAAAAPREVPSLDRGLAAICPFEPDGAGDCEGFGLRPAVDRSGRAGGAAHLDGVRAYARLMRP